MNNTLSPIHKFESLMRHCILVAITRSCHTRSADQDPTSQIPPTLGSCAPVRKLDYPSLPALVSCFNSLASLVLPVCALAQLRCALHACVLRLSNREVCG